MTEDPNSQQNAEAAKLTAAGRERDLRQRADKIAEKLQNIPDEDRRQVLDDALIKVKSSLSVR